MITQNLSLIKLNNQSRRSLTKEIKENRNNDLRHIYSQIIIPKIKNKGLKKPKERINSSRFKKKINDSKNMKHQLT